MSGTGRRFSDDALTQVLDHWLADGPKAMPEDSVDAALRAVAITRQRQWRGRFMRFAASSPLVPVSLTVAGIALVIALGIGIGQVLPPPGTENSPTPGFTIVPTPDGTAPPSGLHLYTNEEDGYEVLVTGRWTEVPGYEESYSGVAYFDEEPLDDSPPGLAISIGSPEGEIYLCAPCRKDVAQTMDALEQAVREMWPVEAVFGSDPAPAIAEYIEPMTLGGEPARFRSIQSRSHILHPHFHCAAYTIHNGQPVVLSFGCDIQANGLADMPGYAGILASFRFLGDSAELDPFTDPDGVYRVELPSGWRANPNYLPDSVTFFSDGYATAVIFLGDGTGSITVCQFTPCQRVAAGTLEELGAALEVTELAGPDGEIAPPPEFDTTVKTAVLPAVLGGEPAERKGPRTPPGWLLGPTMYDWVYAIHVGRPVAIRLDHWRTEGQTQLLDSFEFVTAGTSL